MPIFCILLKACELLLALKELVENDDSTTQKKKKNFVTNETKIEHD